MLSNIEKSNDDNYQININDFISTVYDKSVQIFLIKKKKSTRR